MAENGNIKRQHTAQFKTTVALELLKELDTLAKISSKYGIHPTQARRWRDIAVTSLQNIFTGKPPDAQIAEKDKLIEELYKQIGQQKVELDWVKKRLDLSIVEKILCIEKDNPDISIARQCELLDLTRSVFYYERKPVVSGEDKIIMDYIDKIYTDIPFYGVPRMTLEVNERLLTEFKTENRLNVSMPINHKRIYRLMRIVGIQALRPKPNLSIPEKTHRIYPYLLKDVLITHTNHVWSIDI